VRHVLAILVALAAAAPAVGQVAVRAGYNPYTGRAGTTAFVRNPWTGATQARTTTANPFTGTRTTYAARYNPYTGVTSRGGAAYNPYTGRVAGYRTYRR
jgi:hypothetical protein